MDAIAKMKAAAREGWSTFAPFETATGTAAPELVRYAGVAAGSYLLDVGCGTGVVAVTAARAGAHVTGLDLTPALLERARENAMLAQVNVEFHEGDVEALPFADARFDFVLSQFGHMFGPRPDITIAEMLRVLKPGGVIAFSTWPPDLYTGCMFKLIGTYAPPPPEGAAPPVLWGDPNVVRQRLEGRVTNLRFDSRTMWLPALSVTHIRLFTEANAGPVSRLVDMMAGEPDRLAQFRSEFDALVADYFHDNRLRQDYLMSRAVKL
jgi:SAM-dependent methyltransferase